MNEFLIQISRPGLISQTEDSTSNQHVLLGDTILFDKGAVSYFYENKILRRSLLVIGNAIPRKRARQKVDHWLNSRQLITENEAPEWCRSYNGIFIIIFVDELQQSLRIMTDFLGFYPLYKFEDQRQICLSNSMKWLASQCIPKPEFDAKAIYSYLHNGHLMFEQSWFKGIKRCDPASLYFYNADTKELHSKRYWSWEQIPPKRIASRKGMEEYAYLFHQSTTDLDLADFSSIGVALSGGLDSRWITQILAKERTCSAYCFSLKNNWELSLSKKVASAVHIPHTFHELEESNWLENRLEAFWNGDGCLHLGHLHEGSLHRELFQHADVFYHGFYGGGIYGGNGELNKRIHPEVASRYFKVEDGKYKVDDPYFNVKTIDPYIVYHRMRYQAAYSISLLSGYTKIAVPFYDLDWIMYNYSIDDRDQAYGKFYLEVLNRELSEELLDIPWQRTGLAPRHIQANCFMQKYRLHAAWERVYNLFGKSRHFINYSVFDKQIKYWLKEFAMDIQNLEQDFPLNKREHQLRMLSLVVWMRMLNKKGPNVL